MKIIIAGSRQFKRGVSDLLVARAIAESPFTITKVLCGMAPGIDMAGYRWALQHLGKEYIEEYPADWKRYHNNAGLIRNCKMAQAADGLIAVWDGSSSGTAHMVETMNKNNKPVFLFRSNMLGGEKKNV